MSKNNANLREGGFIVKARRVIRFAAGMTLILIVLMACSGGVESNFSVSNDGFDFQADKPKFFVEEIFSSELPLLDQVRMHIEAVRGNIVIEGRDDTDSITITARKEVGSTSLEDAEESLKGLEIMVTDQIDEVTIQTLQPENRQAREYIVDYHIILPSTLETEVTVVSGDVDVLNVQKSLLINAVNGTVFLSNISASVEVNLTSGNIDSTLVIPLDGDIRIYVDNGNIDLSIPTTTSAEFAADVTNGSIVTYNLEFEAAVQTDQSLTGTLGNGEGVIDISSTNGNISVIGLY
jgi:DUF4097 and DUF4098 domain-containing protein YvlB